jgi:tRNA(Ile)-lysidine synthase
MAADLRSRFLRYVRHKRLVHPGDRVLVAVSGGVDSMTLLHLFRSCAEELGVAVVAAHFDHAMRDSSAHDADFVAKVCERSGIALVRERAQEPLRSEAHARAARYHFLMHAQSENGCNRIATAHHADDQIETVLFRLMRGAGLRGLSGIPLRRGPIIRPLLRFSKQDLERYAADHEIAYREDESNATEQFARNRIRRTVLPALQSARPELPGQLLLLARHAARTEGAWRERIRTARKHAIRYRDHDVTELARGILLEYDAATRARLMRHELRRFGVVPDRAATDRMMQFVDQSGSGSRFEVSAGLRIERAYDLLRITRVRVADTDTHVHIGDCTSGGGEAAIGGSRWRVTWTTSPMQNDDAERFDCPALSFPLELRAWRAGDRIRLPYGSKKLKKLFAEARVPVHRRAKIPILVDADGRICWVVGVARSVDAPAMQNAPSLTIMVTHVEIS